MTAARRGSFVAATWLIGLGSVFLVRQAMGLDWGEAWPLFVILVGVAGVAALVVDGPGSAGLWAFTWPIAWVGVGVVLLASTTGNLRPGPAELLATWWPLAAIGLGAWFLLGAVVTGGKKPVEEVVIPLEAGQNATVHIKFGAGRLTTHRAAPGRLVDGSFSGGVTQRRLGPNQVELRQATAFGLPWIDYRCEWTMGLTGEIPLDLRIEGGASQAILDLRDLRLRSLDIRTGASETRVTLPAAAGVTTVHAEAGAASLVFTVPAGVAARIRTRMALGGSKVDETRFPRLGDLYQSADYATSPNRVDIDAQGGMGSIQVIAEG